MLQNMITIFKAPPTTKRDGAAIAVFPLSAEWVDVYSLNYSADNAHLIYQARQYGRNQIGGYKENMRFKIVKTTLATINDLQSIY